MRSSSPSTITAKWCQPLGKCATYAMLGHNALGLRLLRLWGKSWSPWLLLGLGLRRRSWRSEGLRFRRRNYGHHWRRQDERLLHKLWRQNPGHDLILTLCSDGLHRSDPHVINI